jgi:hypothetical protein
LYVRELVLISSGHYGDILVSNFCTILGSLSKNSDLHHISHQQKPNDVNYIDRNVGRAVASTQSDGCPQVRKQTQFAYYNAMETP